MANIGSAQIQIEVALGNFLSDIRQVFSQAEVEIEKLQSRLKFNPDGSFDKIEEDIKDIGKASQQTTEETKKFGDAGENAVKKLFKLEAVQAIINGIKQAFTGVKDYVMDFVNSWADAELTQEKLRGGLERMGSGDYLQPLLDQASQLQSITPFSDDEIVNMQSLLTTFSMTGEEIQALTPAMLDLSSAFARAGDTGMDLQQVALLIGKGVGADMVGAMGRVGIIMTDVQKQMLETAQGMDKVNIFLDIMKQNGSITAEAFGKTLAGQMKIAQNSIDDIKESIGKALAPAIQDVITAVMNWVELFQQLPIAIQVAVAAIGALIIAGTALVAVAIAFDIATAGIMIVIGALVAGLAGLGVVIGVNIDSIKNFINENEALSAAFEIIGEVVDYVLSQLSDLWDFIVSALTDAFEEIKGNLGEVYDSLGITAEGSDNLLSTIKDLIARGFEVLKEVISTVIEFYLRINGTVTEFIARNEGLTSALIWLGDKGFTYVGTMILGTISHMLTMIDVAGRVAQALGGIVTALKVFIGGNLLDVITNPSKVIGDLEAGIQQIGDAFKSKVENSLQNNIQDSFSTPELIVGKDLINKKPGDYFKKGPKKDTPGGTKGNSGNSGKEKKEVDPLKEEKKALDEIIKSYEHELKLLDDKIKLEEETVDTKREFLGAYIQELQSQLLILQGAENRQKVEEKISSLTVERAALLEAGEKQILDEIFERNNNILDSIDDQIKLGESNNVIKLQALETYENELIAQQQILQDKEQLKRLEEEIYDIHQQRLELADKIAETQQQGELELQTMILEREGETTELTLLQIDAKYAKEQERIEQTYAGLEIKEKLLGELRRRKIAEVYAAENQEMVILYNTFQNTFNTITNTLATTFSNLWNNIFGEARNLLTDFIGFFIAELTRLAATKVFSFILDVLSGGLFGGVFGIVGAAFGGGRASGGPVKKGVAYEWQENGKEYLIPGEDGFVLNATISEALQSGIPVMHKYDELINHASSLRGSSVPSFNSGLLDDLSGQIKTGKIDLGRAGVNIGGINLDLNVENNSLSGLDQDTWNRVVDEELLPQLSDGLRRVGKDILDSKINK